ncbi:MAG: hypothetical protein K0B37_17750 [Bacteroidales bacterium]|nr:hypothetical protein [Bacteroidales bacterium]
MKKYLILIVCSLLYIGCDKVNDDKVNDDQFDNNDPSVLNKNNIATGNYMGYFIYQDKSYWCQIVFENNKYEEWPSGGVAFQKEMSCLTVGNFTINEEILTFKLGSYKHPGFPSTCDPVMILPANYKIHLITENDSIVFSKGVEKNKIKYHLKRITP